MAEAHVSIVRIAVIGTGLIGPRHAHTVIKNSDTELVAIVEPLSHGVAIAKELGTQHYHSVADLLSSPDKPDAAIICTPNNTHVAVAHELISAGVDLLIEKPVSSDVESGKELLDLVNASDVKVLVGHNRRFNSYVAATKDIISSGSLGEVLAVNGLWTLYKPIEYFDPPTDWRRGNNGGVMLINMIHEVDLLQYFFGPIARVHAERTLSKRGFDAEEGAAIVLRFKSGVVGTFLISDHTPSPFNFEAGTGENPLIPHVGQDIYRILGTEATLSVPDMTRWSYDNSLAKSWTEKIGGDSLLVTPGVPFELQLAHFVRVIRGQTLPLCTVQAGLSALIVCDAIKMSIRTGVTIELADLGSSGKGS